MARSFTDGGFAPDHAPTPGPMADPEHLGGGFYRHPADGMDPRHVVGKPHDDRARQFVPFMALKGYYELVRQVEQVAEPRRAQTDEDARMLSDQLRSLQRDQMVRVTLYDKDHYRIACGRVQQVDVALRFLRLRTEDIPFDRIDRIEVAES